MPMSEATTTSTCPRCSVAMTPAHFTAREAAVYRRKGFWQRLTEKAHALECRVCSKCGYVELYISDPDAFTLE